jgi:DNA repair protein RecN (Recombination protein N)
MLKSLSVKNFILIDTLEIEFRDGLTVITGETGAGKSVLLDAILFSLGKKSSNDVIKHGCEYCSVTATFTLDNNIRAILQQLDIEADTELLIKRVQKFGNQKKFFINDQVVTLSTLHQVVDNLFELHGQHNHTLLLNPSSHINILDDYGCLLNLKARLLEHFDNLQQMIKQIAQIAKVQGELEKEKDYLIFSIEELEDLNVKVDEEEELSNTRRNLQNREKELLTIKDIVQCLDNPSIEKSINSAQRIIARHLQLNSELPSISSLLDNAYDSLEEARIKLQHLFDNVDDSEYQLDKIEERLFKIREYARKHNIVSNEIPKFLDETKEKLIELNRTIGSAQELETDKVAEQSKYYELAHSLSKKRLLHAANLEVAVQNELQQLQMEKAIFKISVTNKADYENQPGSNGIDNVCFMASTNPGMQIAPINKVASGGELSRFMLALKTSLFNKSSVATIIFDEIDTGIGGMVADKVGERLKKLGEVAQVIVVTHQAQVAGKAANHILVSKVQHAGTTEIAVRNLTYQERQHEIARMISGKSLTEASIKAAEELINN